MKNFFGILKKSIVFVALISSAFYSQITNDIIKPLTIFDDAAKVVLLSDLFYARNYDAKILPNDDVAAKYNAAKNELEIKVVNRKIVFTTVSVILDSDTLDIPIVVKRKTPVLFRFPAKRKYKFVSVFGSFNDWKRNQFEMHREGDYYVVTVNIRAGNYQYKFFADGEEFCDSENPDSVSNGMGGFNSVLSVPPVSNEKIFVHRKFFEKKKGKTIFGFYVESDSEIELRSNNVSVFLDNKLLRGDEVKINGADVAIELTNERLDKARRLRLIVHNQTVTNVQNVFLEEGEPGNKSKNWDWRESIIYSLMIDRFFDGDKSNSQPLKHDSLAAKANYMGGDLRGIIDKLDEGYFDSLGINVLWISPVYDNPNKPYREYPPPHRWFAGYHGYWPVNSFGVDEHFGSLDLLRSLVRKAHSHGIKVLLDFVSNHVHIENPIYQNHENWFGSLYLPDGRKNIRFWDEYRLTTWFEPYLPSFDYLGSDKAVEFMTDNAVWWLRKTGADGFRHDAVKHVPNKFWRRLTRKLKEEGFQEIYQIGETFGSDMLVASYVCNGQLNAQFNFNLYNTALETFLDTTRSFKSLLEELETTFSYYGYNNLMGNIMDSHDKNRFMAFADGDLSLEQWSAVEEGWNNPPIVDNPASYRKAILYYAYMFGIPGIPVVYYGSEFGMSGASDPDNRRMMRFGSELNEHEKEMLDGTSSIIALRRNHSALNYGDFYPLLAEGNIFAFVRSDFNERILVVLNKSFDKEQKVTLRLPAFYEAGELANLINGETVEVNDNFTEIVLPPLSWRYFIIK